MSMDLDEYKNLRVNTENIILTYENEQYNFTPIYIINIRKQVTEGTNTFWGQTHTSYTFTYSRLHTKKYFFKLLRKKYIEEYKYGHYLFESVQPDTEKGRKILVDNLINDYIKSYKMDNNKFTFKSLYTQFKNGDKKFKSLLLYKQYR